MLRRPLAHLLVLSVLVATVALAGPPLAGNSAGGPEAADTAPEAATEVFGPVRPVGTEVESAVEPPDPAPVGATAAPTAVPTPAGLRLASYTVQPGDTLADVATKFDLDTLTLLWANNLPNADLLQPGTELAIPPAPGVLHQVQPGDTLLDLASHYKADFERVVAVNGLQPPYVITVGQPVLLVEGRMPPRPTPDGPTEPVEVDTPEEGPALAADLAAPVAAVQPLPYPQGATPEQADFILTAAQAARASKRETGVPASVTIAQAILESFWGASRLSRENHNYFGIKAKERPGTAGVVWYDTWEVIGGRNVIQHQPFRAYKTATDSFVDHGRFFHENPRYAAALQAAGDAKQFAREINRAGYATDPAYALKLIGLMDRFNLYQYDE